MSSRCLATQLGHVIECSDRPSWPGGAICGISILLFLSVAPAWAQTPDSILINGKILTVDSDFSIREALAIHDGRILAVGTSSDIRKAAGPRTQVIDLQGRTVTPGLIDSHLHAIRAGLTYSTEVNWVGAGSLTEAMNRIRQAAATMKPGAWLIVGGGWTTNQFKERRRPTQAEPEMAAPVDQIVGKVVYAASTYQKLEERKP